MKLLLNVTVTIAIDFVTPKTKISGADWSFMAAGHSADKLLDLHNFDLVTLLLMDIYWQNSLLLWMMANIHSVVELMIRNNIYTQGYYDLGHCLSDHTTTRDHPLTKANSLKVWLSAGILLTWKFLH